MQKTSLTALARQQLKLAPASSGRSSSTVYGGLSFPRFSGHLG